ncbi:magnesium transporter [Desulfotomaculum copahuensis]|uniref:Magnesium transporter MgtE n=1 Tax=Desulfotomaculum copahuensis TaxID=1838280 RepID=A0A1B7LD25_9FIRM|nr:CBS domain-containing protein [Desulfotomaculum copahuensis]OAT80828.1 magnesium transporter MgtE [Desulfotomaculum copahuensis]
MDQVKVLGEFFFSQVQGRPIYDGRGRIVGRLRDMTVRWDGICPRVTGIKYAPGVQKHISIGQIEHWDERGLRLKGELVESDLATLQANEIYAGKWLLDKQIIDLKGSKLVRVNDIKLSWVRHQETYDVILLAVDIGLRGLFRRIGAEFLVKKREQHLVGWQYIKPLEEWTANLRLRREQEGLSQLHPADIADIIEDLDHQERTGFIDRLDDETAAEALAEVDLDTQVEIIERMDSGRASDILEEMPPDEAADILGELPEEKSRELLELMEPDEAEDVRELMEYPEDTAGALMTTEYIAFPAGMTAGGAINRLRELAPAAETVYYLYVVDEQEVLQGVISLRDLIISPPQAALGGFMRTRVISVNHHDDHRKVLDAVAKYNLLAVPVVDDRGAIMGIITVDDVLETLVPDRSGLDSFSHFMLRRKPGRGWGA